MNNNIVCLRIFKSQRSKACLQLYRNHAINKFYKVRRHFYSILQVEIADTFMFSPSHKSSRYGFLFYKNHGAIEQINLYSTTCKFDLIVFQWKQARITLQNVTCSWCFSIKALCLTAEKAQKSTGECENVNKIYHKHVIIA